MSKLNKALHRNITDLKLCSKSDASVKFLLDKSPFPDDDDEPSATASSNECVILGRILPKSDIFKEGAFQIEMKLTDNFPVEPPQVRFITPIYHPNVAENGEFCHQLLKTACKWKQTTSLVDVVKAVVEYIDNPDLDYALRPNVAQEYTGNRPEFKRIALEMVNKHALPRQ